MSYYYDFQSETDWLKNIVFKSESELSSLPEGRIRVIKHGNGRQFYHVTKQTPQNGIFVKSNQRSLIKLLVRKEYLEKVIAFSKARLKLLAIVKKLNEIPGIDSAYSGLSNEKKKIIDNVFEYDTEAFLENWINEEYKPNDYPFGESEYYTLNGERVRSKTEIVIADTLYQNGIPYKYEKPYLLNNGKTVYPDFTILNKRTRQEYIFEHFGLMDNEEYRLKAWDKIELYTKLFGDRFLFTFEEYHRPFHRSHLEFLIKKYLL